MSMDRLYIYMESPKNKKKCFMFLAIFLKSNGVYGLLTAPCIILLCFIKFNNDNNNQANHSCMMVDAIAMIYNI